MKTKVKIQDALGEAIQTPKGFIRSYLVTDIMLTKSVIKVFSKDLTLLPATGELVIDCNEFCFISK